MASSSRNQQLLHSGRQAAPAGELLQSGMHYSAPESMLKTLMEVADLPEFIFDPTILDAMSGTAPGSQLSSRPFAAPRMQSPRPACRS